MDNVPARIGIIGTGLAGLRAAAELRAAGYEGEIAAWDAEAREPYDRPPLTKSLFENPLRPLAADGLGDLGELDVPVVPEAVTRLRRAKRGWEVSGVPVDVAIVASGAAPRATIPGARVLHTIDDATALASRVTRGSRVAIVGAGWVGTELASVCSAAGALVDLWESSPHILGRTFRGAVDEEWARWLARAGVALHLGQSFPGSAGTVVQATGSSPAVGFLGEKADLTARGAFATDRHARVLSGGTPIPDLYAVGDCADMFVGENAIQGGHWRKALGDATIVAAAILGIPGPAHLAPPEVFSTQFGHEIAVVGTVPPGRPTRQSTGSGWTLRWEDEQGLRALLAVDSPRELSRARKTLRMPLR